MQKKGHIYLITNKINGKQYVGQTARDIWTRFEEHCKNSHIQYSAISQAIEKYGYLNFELKEIEEVPIDKLDEREIYWIQYYKTYENGYNQNRGGGVIRDYPHLLVVENNLVIDSIEEFGRLASEQVGWSARSISQKVREVVDSQESFLGYHFVTASASEYLSAEDAVKDWIQTLQIRFNGKHIYCFELKREFSTIAECARYLLDNNLYITTSKTPLQSVVTAIGKQLHGSISHICGKEKTYTFCFLPGSTKNTGEGEPFSKTKVYCHQIDKEFDSQLEAATYMLDNKLWQGIKLKTAKLRISDVVNGHFPDYKGYTFERR